MTMRWFKNWILNTLAALLALVSTGRCDAQSDSPSTPRSDALKSFLQAYVLRLAGEHDGNLRYLAAPVDLDGAGTGEMLVHLVGSGWCGSGGCTTLVLLRDRISYKVLTKIMISRPPIRVLQKTSNGWHDLAVWVQGGGIAGYESDLPFNGTTYASNPSVAPAHPLRTRTPGKTIFASTELAQPLFP
jgi:hypothetical protein